MSDFAPDRAAADLIDALYEARRSNRVDLAKSIVPLLQHDDPMVREEAASLLLTKWELRWLRDTAVEMVLHDEDDGVRSRVAYGIAAMSTSSTRESDGKLLASVFENAESSDELRRGCVEALHLMLGRPKILEWDDVGAKAVHALLAEIANLAE